MLRNVPAAEQLTFSADAALVQVGLDGVARKAIDEWNGLSHVESVGHSLDFIEEAQRRVADLEDFPLDLSAGRVFDHRGVFAEIEQAIAGARCRKAEKLAAGHEAVPAVAAFESAVNEDERHQCGKPGFAD